MDAAKKTNQRTANKFAEQEYALKDTVTPMLAKIYTIQAIGNGLLKVGYKNMVAINDFLNRLILAADFFDNDRKRINPLFEPKKRINSNFITKKGLIELQKD